MAESIIPRRKEMDKELEEKINWLLANDATLRNRKHVIRAALVHFYNWKKDRVQKIE